MSLGFPSNKFPKDEPVKTNHSLGIEAELACENYLVENGYEILARRYKTKAGEVDIIAKDGNCLVFVEVKRRKADIVDDPISRTQKRRITNAAEHYLAANEKFLNFDMRFDCIFVDNNLILNHIVNSWSIEEL